MTNLAVMAPDGSVNYAPWALFAILMVVAIVALVTISFIKTYVANSSDSFQ